MLEHRSIPDDGHRGVMVNRTSYPIRLPGFEGLPVSSATRAGDLVFISGQLPLDHQGAVASPGDVAGQATMIFDNIARILDEAGGSIDDVVDVMSFHKGVRDIDDVLDVARAYFQKDPPAWTPVGMTGSYSSDVLISIRAIAHLGKDPKQCVVPETIECMTEYPVSAGCRKGSLIFIAGQSALDPGGNVVAPGDHTGQSRYAYLRIRDVIGALGGTMNDVIDICSFHLDPRGMGPSERVHNLEVWEGVDPGNAPPWTAIGVPHLWRPGALSQYRVIADLSGGPRIGRVSASVHWKNTPNAGASRKQRGNLIGIAGQVASDAEGNVTTPGDTFSQARYAFRRIRECIEMHGSTMDKVVEVTAFQKDYRAMGTVMDAAKEFFREGEGPAWTSVGVTGLWNPGYLHEIHALAVT